MLVHTVPDLENTFESEFVINKNYFFVLRNARKDESHVFVSNKTYLKRLLFLKYGGKNFTGRSMIIAIIAAHLK